VYVAESGSGSGKSAVALGLAELLSRRVPRLGAFRPVVDDAPNPTIALLHERYRMGAPLADLHGVTAAEATRMIADGGREELVVRVVERFRALDHGCDAIVVVGSDIDDEHSRSGIPRTLAFNARLANEFGAVVVVVVNGADQEQAAVDALARAAYHSFVDLGASVAAVVVNRVRPGVRAPDLPVAAYAVAHVAAVAAPTVAEVAEALGATLLSPGGAADVRTALDRDVTDYVVGAAQVPALLPHLTDGCLLITPGDRADLLLAAAGAHVAGLATLAGIVVTLGLTPQRPVMRVFEHLAPGVAVLGVPTGSYETIAASTRIEHRLAGTSPRKVQAALGAFESAVDGDELARQLDVRRSERVTPLMFEYDLVDRARAARRHVVLPEGAEERILRAADALLRRDVCDLTLLGDPDAIRRRTRALGLALDGARIVDPARSPELDRFAASYAELRRHRGVTPELARDVVRDVNYFGTLMVHHGLADGMVSGSVHTTAATIRPAFEIIKILPGTSVASSVFFMLLPDRVLVYGDCAVNPDPTAAQLADIAVSCADTAARFGVTPRVAMLSYSTGTSGAGADVTKVAEATALVRDRRPELPVEGPIQYDAAVDPTVAATKLPGSAVAGRATVLVFPDLNTGNNTYMAVQRSAGAVAVGPIMQGLRRPVNDLSRGATVKDIITTVAITAIQAGPAGTAR
jgi:phosphate acetyltransferase